MTKKKVVLVTGADGFIGRNLCTTLDECNEYTVLKYTRHNTIDDLNSFVLQADAVIHLAGVNRSKAEDDFYQTNAELTTILCELIGKHNTKPRIIIYTSSIHATDSSIYGFTKKLGEQELIKLSNLDNITVNIYRLPGIFGKWAKPNYNSVVSTFCHNVANNKPIKIDDENKEITLNYIDDVTSELVKGLSRSSNKLNWPTVTPVYEVSLGTLAQTIKNFKSFSQSLMIDLVGEGFLRALYSTYLTYIPTNNFVVPLKSHIDARGSFTEIIKTKNSGQFSFLTAAPGVSRGRHYHHTKNEKFLVVQGHARFRYKNISTLETFCIEASSENYELILAVPGWAHEITNIGKQDLIILIWANEVFNQEKTDTIQSEI